jgi:hypothetical protein
LGNRENLSKYWIRLKGPDEFTEKWLRNLIVKIVRRIDCHGPVVTYYGDLLNHIFILVVV